MMYSEFTEIINKEVDFGFYQEVIEPMYNASDLSKQESCALLNVEALPESKRSIEAREERERLLKLAHDDLLSLKEDLAFYDRLRGEARNSLEYWKSLQDREMCKTCAIDVRLYASEIKRIKAKIKEIKFTYGI